MPLYRYQALDGDGARKTGIMEAMSEREAKERLRGQGLMVTSLNERKGVSGKENFTGEALLAFTAQVSQLINAGIPLYDCLVALEEQYRGTPMHRVVASLGNQIKSGVPLSEAMKSFPNSFDRLYRALVAAGEAVGGLGMVMERLGQLLAKQMSMKSQITTAMIYPTILAGFCFLIIGMLLGFVVPSLEGMFQDREVNAFTGAVLAISRVARGYWWLYIPAVAGGITFAFFKLRTEAGKEWLQRTSLKLPLFRTLTIQAATARFCRTMATLGEGGLPMIDSLRIARETVGNVAMEEVVQEAEEKIMAGSTLAKELSKSDLFPKMASRMLAVGEEAGTSVLMLNRIADMYEGELEKTLTRLMSFAQPVILIFMGGIIGVVMVAILLPMSDVASFTQG